MNIKSGMGMPPQVEAAFRYLNWMAENAVEFEDEDFSPHKFAKGEKAVHEASLEVIRLYLRGEMAFGPVDASIPSVEQLKKQHDVKC